MDDLSTKTLQSCELSVVDNGQEYTICAAVANGVPLYIGLSSLKRVGVRI
jgi:hypothetical protein